MCSFVIPDKLEQRTHWLPLLTCIIVLQDWVVGTVVTSILKTNQLVCSLDCDGNVKLWTRLTSVTTAVFFFMNFVPYCSLSCASEFNTQLLSGLFHYYYLKCEPNLFLKNAFNVIWRMHTMIVDRKVFLLLQLKKTAAYWLKSITKLIALRVLSV